MDHLSWVKHEFSRQADRFATSAGITDEQQTELFVEALGTGDVGTVLDVACGPGIITVALAARAREVVAFQFDTGNAEESPAAVRERRCSQCNIQGRKRDRSAVPAENYIRQ